MFLNHVPSNQSDALIDKINNGNKTWEANACMLQESHPNYNHELCSDSCPIESEFLDLTDPIKNSSKLHQKKKKKHHVHKNRVHVKSPLSGNGTFGEETEEWSEAVSHAQQWKHKYSSVEDIPDSAVPKRWDFRNIKGYDFTGPVRDQGACGSCYTLGFV